MEGPMLEKQEEKMNWPIGRSGFDMLCDFYGLIDANVYKASGNEEKQAVEELRKKVGDMIRMTAAFIEE